MIVHAFVGLFLKADKTALEFGSVLVLRLCFVNGVGSLGLLRGGQSKCRQVLRCSVFRLPCRVWKNSGFPGAHIEPGV